MYCEGVFEKSLDCRQEHLFGKMSMKQQAAKLYHERMMNGLLQTLATWKPCLWEFLRYALRLHLLFSLFGDKSNTSMDMSGSGRIPPLPNVLVYLLSYNLVAAAGTERWLTWEKQESGAGMIWPSNLAPKIQSSYPLVRSNSSVVERLREK